MPATAAPASFRQELYAGHALVMQCGTRAAGFLDRAGPAGRDPRAENEAIRMAALTARLMENVRRGFTLTQAGRAPMSLAAAPKSTEAMPIAKKGKLHPAPDASRGRLKNGNPSGDYLRPPRCGARTRAGCACRQPAMPNGRCRLHGGLSTGPRTPEGRRRAQTARLVHGYRTAELIGLRSRAAHAARRLRALNATARPAGHGVHRSNSLNRRDAETPRMHRGGIFEAPLARAARHQSSSASPRLCGEPPAGHGVHRPDSIHHRDHRGHREGIAAPYARKARHHSSSVFSVPSVVKPSSPSAGHGVHRSNPISRGWRTALRWLQDHAMPRRPAHP